MRLGVVAAAVLAVSISNPTPAAGQAGGCVELCRIPCVKPISIPDRWDDVTGIPGYMGEVPRRPDWRNNARWDCETLMDTNGNALHDPGESFIDGNLNGVYDAEAYDSVLTGYRPAIDLGLEITLHPGSSSDPPLPGQFYTVGLPPANKGTPDLTDGAYGFAWTDCQPTAIEAADRLQLRPNLLIGPTNQFMFNLFALDPDANWDPQTQSIQNSSFDLSPRVFLVPVYDPRMPIVAGSNFLVVQKVVAFFAEQMVGPAEVRGRLLRVEAPGESCGGGSAGGFVISCPVPAAPVSWGRVKASYR